MDEPFHAERLVGQVCLHQQGYRQEGIDGNKTILDLCETTCAPYQVGHCFEEALPDAPLGTDPTGEEFSCRIILWKVLLFGKATGKDICNSMAQSTPAKDIAAGVFSPAAGLNTKANYKGEFFEQPLQRLTPGRVCLCVWRGRARAHPP